MTASPLICSLSAAPCHHPVVSVRSGHVFDKRVIEKALSVNGGKCPHTGVPLSMTDDLIPINVPAIVTTNSIPPSSTDVPSMLRHVENEWDARMVEVHQLRKDLDQCKKTLHSTRQQLATALYRLDAAHRVIAKLKKGASEDEENEVSRKNRTVIATGTEDEEGKMEARNGDSDENGNMENGGGKSKNDKTKKKSVRVNPDDDDEIQQDRAPRKRKRTTHPNSNGDDNGDADQQNTTQTINRQMDDDAAHTTAAQKQAKLPSMRVKEERGAELQQGDGEIQPDVSTSSNPTDAAAAIPKLLPDALLAEMTKLSKTLSQARKARKMPGWATAKEVSTMRLAGQCTLDVKGKGISISSLAVSRSGRTAYCGLSNGTIEQVDVNSMQVAGAEVRMDGEDKASLSALWMDQDVKLWSGDESGNVRLWDVSNTRRCESVWRVASAVVGLQTHPLGQLALLGYRTGWNWTDVETGATLSMGKSMNTNSSMYEYSNAKIHPDGMFFATGTTAAAVQLWDVNSMSIIHSLGADSAGKQEVRVDDLAMSEKGYYLASACGGTVSVWDLRKRAVVGTVMCGDALTGVALDGAGEFGCAVGGNTAICFGGRKGAKVYGKMDVGSKWRESTSNNNGGNNLGSKNGGTGGGGKAVVAWGDGARHVVFGTTATTAECALLKGCVL